MSSEPGVAGNVLKLLLGIAAYALLWARSRWRWLASCGGAILVALYAHSEYLQYVAGLPADSEAANAAKSYLGIAFAAKNIVIAGALLTYLVYEMRVSKRRRVLRKRLAAMRSAAMNASENPGVGSIGIRARHVGIDDTGHEWDDDPAEWVRQQRRGDDRRSG